MVQGYPLRVGTRSWNFYYLFTRRVIKEAIKRYPQVAVVTES